MNNKVYYYYHSNNKRVLYDIVSMDHISNPAAARRMRLRILSNLKLVSGVDLMVYTTNNSGFLNG